MTPGPLVLFDGPCNLCRGSVRFILKHEKSPELRFVSLQSETGKEQLSAFRVPENTDAMVLILDGKAYAGSDASFRICLFLKAPWSWLAVFRHLPGWLHQPVYRWIARHRYRWFGKNETCPLPDPDQAERFL